MRLKLKTKKTLKYYNEEVSILTKIDVRKV